MSLDLWMKSPECPVCKHSENGENFNYTYNVSKMWYEIFPEDKGKGMVYIDGMTGLESIGTLTSALFSLRENPEKFNPMNPENGHGCYKTFIKFIEDLINESRNNPEWIWESCR